MILSQVIFRAEAVEAHLLALLAISKQFDLASASSLDVFLSKLISPVFLQFVDEVVVMDAVWIHAAFDRQNRPSRHRTDSSCVHCLDFLLIVMA